MPRWLLPENIKPLPEILFENARQHPDRTALDYYGRKFSYAQTKELTLRFAAVFAQFFKNSDPRVGLLLPNLPQFVFGYFGAQTAGAVAVPVSFASIAKELKSMPARDIKVSDEIRAQIADSRPDVLLAADFFLPLLEQMKDELKDTAIILTSPADFLPFPMNLLYPLKARKEGRHFNIPKGTSIYSLKTLLRDTPRVEYYKYGKVEDVAQILYTGGTTKLPKGVMLSHRNIISNVLQCREHLGDRVREGMTALGVLPFFHSYGITACMNVILLGLKGTIVLMPAFTPREAVKLIRKKNISLFPGVNRMFQSIADNVKDAGLPSLELCISGAGPLDLEVKKGFEQMTGARVVEGYGMTETGPVISITVPEQDVPGSVGPPVPGTEVKILDTETGEELGPDLEGEIVVRGPQVMLGYRGKPEETAEVLKDGWLHTGDIGPRDKEGRLRITGRKDDMFKVMGEKVFSRVVEDYFLTSPMVLKCAVIGVPDPKSGNRPVAYIVLKAGAFPDDLDQHLAAIPIKLWLPKDILTVTEEQFGQWEDIIGKLNHKRIKKYYQANH